MRPSDQSSSVPPSAAVAPCVSGFTTVANARARESASPIRLPPSVCSMRSMARLMSPLERVNGCTILAESLKAITMVSPGIPANSPPANSWSTRAFACSLATSRRDFPFSRSVAAIDAEASTMITVRPPWESPRSIRGCIRANATKASNPSCRKRRRLGRRRWNGVLARTSSTLRFQRSVLGTAVARRRSLRK